MAEKHKPVALGAQVNEDAPPDHATAKAAAAENKAKAIEALLEARDTVAKIEAALTLVAGDDALAGAHCTLRTVASMLGAEASILGG